MTGAEPTMTNETRTLGARELRARVALMLAMLRPFMRFEDMALRELVDVTYQIAAEEVDNLGANLDYGDVSSDDLRAEWEALDLAIAEHGDAVRVEWRDLYVLGEAVRSFRGYHLGPPTSGAEADLFEAIGAFAGLGLLRYGEVELPAPFSGDWNEAMVATGLALCRLVEDRVSEWENDGELPAHVCRAMRSVIEQYSNEDERTRWDGGSIAHELVSISRGLRDRVRYRLAGLRCAAT